MTPDRQTKREQKININNKRWREAGIEVGLYLAKARPGLTYCEGAYYPQDGGMVLPAMICREARWADPSAAMWVLEQKCGVPPRRPSPNSLDRWLTRLRQFLDAKPSNLSLWKPARVKTPPGGWIVGPRDQQGELILALRRRDRPATPDNLARAVWLGVRPDAPEPRCRDDG